MAAVHGEVPGERKGVGVNVGGGPGAGNRAGGRRGLTTKHTTITKGRRTSDQAEEINPSFDLIVFFVFFRDFRVFRG
jgi:hypothetical protein